MGYRVEDKEQTSPVLKNQANENKAPSTIMWIGRSIKSLFSRVFNFIVSIFHKAYDTDITTKTISKVEDNSINDLNLVTISPLELQQLIESGNANNNTLYVVTGKNTIVHIKDSNFKVLPKIKMDGTLRIDNCPYFEEITEANIPDITGRRPYRKLEISNCKLFSRLPATPDFNTHVKGCENFKELVAGEYNKIEIENCNNFYKLNPNTSASELALIENKNFTSFPDNLTFGDLRIDRCPIEALTNKMIITRNLSLFECFDLRKIHNSEVELQGDINIIGCNELIKILLLQGWPTWINSIKPDSQRRRISVMNHNIQQINTDLKLLLSTNDYIELDLAELSVNLNSLIKFFIKPSKNADPNTNYVPDIPEDHQRYLNDFLKKILQTADFRSGDRGLLIGQIAEILSLFDKDTDESIYQIVIDTMHDGVSTCVDKTILYVDDLLMLARQQNTEKTGDTEKINELKKHNMIIGILDSIVINKHNKDTHNVDDEDKDIIESLLAYRIKIREKLGLQNGVQHMHYTEYNVKDSEIVEIANLISQQMNDKICNEFFNSNKTWSEFIKSQKNLPDYQTLPAIYIDEIPVCCISDDTDNMVEYMGHYYTYQSLLNIYRENGLDPFTRKQIDTSKIQKILKAS